MPVPLPLVAAGQAGAELTDHQPGGALVRRSVLPGGVRVLSEADPAVRSVGVGVWVPVGSRDEAPGRHGATHFLEHLLFKGTPRRDAMAIAEAFDAVGGEANAATGKEHTCYYARVLDGDLPMAVDVIGDMVTSALLAPAEFETERGVILEELAMNGDDPVDVAHETFAELVFGTHPLARPIGGTPQTIRDVDREAVWEHYTQYYGADTLVVTAAGGVDHEELCDLVGAALDAGGWDRVAGTVPAARRTGEPTADLPGLGEERRVVRPGEQVNMVVGGPALVAGDPRRYVLGVLGAVLGGGMSSRLFQEVREKRGLAYSVYSFAQAHADAGLFGMYAGCAPGAAGQVRALLEAELDRMAEGGITDAELARGIGQLSGNLVLGMEDTGSRMSRLGKAEIVFGELTGVDEALAAIRAVSAEQVRELAGVLAGAPRSAVMVGPAE